ncbi:MAG: Flp family type IVb pilin [Planctomycetia bacterium]|nr:Flp family type IVb pilin [Planctomycetia bacterium]
MKHVARFLADEDGPTAVEYAVMLGLIMMACFSAVALVGTNTTASYTKSSTSISNAMNGK